LSIILFLANFLDFEDITTIISIIVPVSAVYIGSLFQFLGNSFIPPKNEDRIIKKLKVAQSTINLLTGILLIHFLLLSGIILAKAIPLINVQEMTLFFTLVEGAFGTYIGYIINSLFNTNSTLS